MLEALQVPAIGLPVAVLFGMLLGSFGNVIIHRLPRMMEHEWHAQCAELRGEAPVAEASPKYNLMVPRSACPKCGHQIGALENIPVISWLLLRGKCKECGTKISARYPIVEILSGVLAFAAFYVFGLSWVGLAVFGFLYALLVLTFIDADTQLLPDQITLPLVWAGLIVNYFGGITTLSSALWGAVIGYLALWSIYWAFKLLTGKEGMGYGDFKLLAAIGAWLGWEVLPAVILIASVAGAVYGIAQLLRGAMKRGNPMPFGPFLAVAGAIAVFYGPALMRAYLR